MSRGDNINLEGQRVLEFLRNCLKEKDFFIGIRNGYMNLYYKGASAAKITTYKTKSRNKYLNCEGGNVFTSEFVKNEACFEIHKKYIKGIEKSSDNDKDSDYIKVHFDFFNENIQKIKKIIDSHHEEGNDEKICQQWIINKANSSESSDWYYIDMEYIKENEPTGRFDMIAISRKKYSGKHRVALIELKVGDKSYSGIGKKYYEEKEEYNKIRDNKDSLYDYNKEKGYLSFGSGVVGHVSNFMRFLKWGKYEELLKDDIIGIINRKKALGILEEKICFDGLCKEHLADIPEICIISYTNAPGSKTYTDVKKLKTQMYKYIFGGEINGEKCSDYALENLIYRENIKEIVSEEMEKFLVKDEGNKYASTLEIDNKKHEFNFIFVDNSEPDWDCLGKIE